MTSKTTQPSSTQDSCFIFYVWSLGVKQMTLKTTPVCSFCLEVTIMSCSVDNSSQFSNVCTWRFKRTGQFLGGKIIDIPYKQPCTNSLHYIC